MITSPKCFYCGEYDHMVRDCKWKNLPCIAENCSHKMILMVSKVERSSGCRFLRCKNQPICRAFKWVDQPAYEMSTTTTSNSSIENKATTSTATMATTNITSKVKVVKEENGVKLTFEGHVDAVVDLMKKTHMY